MRTLCGRVSQGELVQDVAKELGVSRDTVHAWSLLPEFSDIYARARDQQAHAIAEDALRIADGYDVDATARVEAMAEAVSSLDQEDKVRVLDAMAAVAVQRDRLRVDARKWLASKIAPRHYGEKLDLTSADKPLAAAQIWVFGEHKVKF